MQCEQDSIDWSVLSYAEQLKRKTNALQQALAVFQAPDLSIHESPETGYRMRCEFRVWHEDNDSYYAMYQPGSKELYRVDRFAAAAVPIQACMPWLLAAIQPNELLRRKLFRVEFLSTLSGELLVTLVYHKPLDSDWEQTARELQTDLGIQLMGRSKKQKIVMGQEWVTEQLEVQGQPYRYRQIESTFTQPNATVNQKMLNWACQQAVGIGGDLLELYCGNGNFTLPLSRHFQRVLATEISKGSIAALNWNLPANGIENIAHARLSAEEITQAIDRVRPFRRLAHIDLDQYRFSTIFVDPPRAGVDDQTMQLVGRFDRILYISCNPETLVQNLAQLEKTHKIVAAAAFDQFPFTPHLEAGVMLQKR